MQLQHGLAQRREVQSGCSINLDRCSSLEQGLSILLAFRQVSLKVLEAEAFLETAKDRLTCKIAKHAAKLLATN